jgi:hypothetical protein
MGLVLWISCTLFLVGLVKVMGAKWVCLYENEKTIDLIYRVGDCRYSQGNNG